MTNRRRIALHRGFVNDDKQVLGRGGGQLDVATGHTQPQRAVGGAQQDQGAPPQAQRRKQPQQCRVVVAHLVDDDRCAGRQAVEGRPHTQRQVGSGDGLAMRVARWVAQRRGDAPGHFVADGVLQAVGFLVNLIPGVAQFFV